MIENKLRCLSCQKTRKRHLNMPISFKRFAATVLFSCVAVSQAHAAVITFTSTGTLAPGSTDELGLFQTDLNLEGKRYTQTMTVDTAFLPSKISSPGYLTESADDTTIKFTGTTTVDGHAYSWSIKHGRASLYLALGYRGTEEYEYLDMRGNGTNSFDGLYVDAIAQVYSYPPFNNAFDFTSPRSFDLFSDSSWWYFAAFSNQGVTSFTARPDSLSWQVANPVPEPATQFTFLLGLGLAAAALRRRFFRCMPQSDSSRSSDASAILH
jgi:hypothetical protein